MTHPDSPSGQPYSAPTQAWGGNADPRNLSYEPEGLRYFSPDLPRVEMRYEELNATSWSVPPIPSGNEHLDGVPWWEAPPPPRDHEHWAQTSGWLHEGLERVERCACGAIRSNISPRWVLLDPPRVAFGPGYEQPNDVPWDGRPPQSYLPPPDAQAYLSPEQRFLESEPPPPGFGEPGSPRIKRRSWFARHKFWTGRMR